MKRLKRSSFRCALALSLGATVSASMLSQTQSVPPPASAQIRVGMNEVIVPITVTDPSGEFVLDLSQQDFHVFEDSVEQTIDHWDLGGDPPDVVLVLETSSRLQAMIPAIHAIESIFAETVMALNGEAAVMTYDSTINVRQTFTQDHDSVQKAIARTAFEAPETNLYDAMAAAVELFKAHPPSWRRIMLIVGESQDTGSTAKLGQVVRDAENSNISIYAVGPSSAAADLRANRTGLQPLKVPGLPPVDVSPPPKDHLGRTFFDVTTPGIWLLERGTNVASHTLNCVQRPTQASNTNKQDQKLARA